MADSATLAPSARARATSPTMIGAQADEVMVAVQTAMLANLPYPKLRDAVITHPTIAEGLGPLLSNVPARAEGDE